MASALDPLAASSQIAQSYRRYLLSTFSPRKAELATELEALLRTEFRLTRGPILQASAPFQPGASARELVAEGVLCKSWSELETTFPLDRPLHLHQEQAIRKAVSHGRNLIVSTGTGSGKTESFLVPIIDHLLREREAGTLGQPGVRALLLYPMNALANDQTKRLRRMLAPMTDITFGRYVGETEEQEVKAEEAFRARYPNEPRVPGELLSREEMRATPPHILLTNFAMLEYLLLRPQDTALFDGSTGEHWRFLVLDEAHVYNGAQGTEVAMLLRRVRDRIVMSEKGRLQCFATSATLGRGVSDHPDLVRFGELLFDERFEWTDDSDRQDIVTATRLPLVQGAAELDLPQEAFAGLQRAFRSEATPEELFALLAPHGVTDQPESGVAAAAYLAQVLRAERHVIEMQRLLERSSTDLRDAANRVFTGPTAQADAVALVDLCVAARERDEDAPLLPARYHYFVRALEGGFQCLHPDHRGDHPRLRLTRHQQCPSCDREGREARMFELGVCRHCRAEYLLGRHDELTGVFEPPTEFGDRRDYLLLGDTTTSADDEDGAALDTPGAGPGLATPAFLCPGCGTVADSPTITCDCRPSPRAIPVVKVVPAKGDALLRRCAACAGRASGEVVFRFVTGTDAPVAVVATGLYQAIPASTTGQATQVGEGRKLLTFSDSRQDAAFFAPYLERTYQRAVQRRLIAGAITDLARDEPPATEDVADRVRREAERALVLDPDATRHRQRAEVFTWLVEELLAFDRRQSLEGAGVASISVKVPRLWEPPAALLDLGFSPAEVMDLIQMLLETVRTGGAITVPDGVDIRDERFAPRNMEFGLRRSGPERQVIAWLPGNAANRRLEILAKVFAAKGLDADPAAVLDGLWTHLSDPAGPWAKTLVPVVDKKRGPLLRLDWERFEFKPAGEDHRPSRCGTCLRLWWRTVASICPGWRCNGTVSPVADLDEVRAGHYSSLYRELEPIGISVEEHTAQWTSAEASRIQDRFVSGDVNVLSCSTTFELGVDVGEIQAVLLRNVPPTAANYVQRAGRAGRRTDAAALVVTFAQRRSHDLTFFDNPFRMVDGFVSPPIIHLDNISIGRRHVHAVAYAAFERAWVDSSREPHRSVGDLFEIDDAQGTSGVDSFVDWLQHHPTPLQEALTRVMPPSLASEIGVDDWSWVTALTEPSEDEPTHGWLGRAADEVREELATLEELIAEAYQSEQGWRGDSLRKVRNALANRQAIGFLASRNVLPKYGFPVDVVELNLAGSGNALAAKLDLSRDLSLAISDYAPGAQVVAAKSLWKSVGLATRNGQTWPSYQWGICGDCGAYRQALGELPACPICESPAIKSGKAGRYILPLFGFVGAQADKPGETRPLRQSVTETHFGSYRDADPDLAPVSGIDGPVPVIFRTSRQGQIIVVNRGPMGRGFRVCEWCGYGEPAPEKGGKPGGPESHPDIRRQGKKCSGRLAHRHLGHRYLTDVVEIRIGLPANQMHARSVLYAVLEGVEAIDISRGDVDGTFHFHSRSEPPALVLFDSVAGGAGHALRIAERLPEVLRAGLARMEGCECGLETSCYSCLRNYRNQIFHAELSRGAAIDVLRQVLAAPPPPVHLDDIHDVARPLLRAALDAGCPFPEVGWEAPVPEAWLVELAWEAQQVAVTVGEQGGRDEWLRTKGWTVLPAESATGADLLALLANETATL